MPPSVVSVVTVESEPLAITNELPGRIAPTRIAEVRPRVSGIVVDRVFEQGSIVRQGDTLYQIEPAPFEVLVASAEATLQRAHAARDQARRVSERQMALADKRIISAQQQDDAIAALAQADADVAVADAGLRTARLNLDYASVRAPIEGRIGRALITEGALVSSAESLATIQQLDPVYVDFTQSSGELLRLRQALAAGQLDSPATDQASIRMMLDDGTEYKHRGKLLFSEASVDETTGQVTLRAEFANPDGDLLPGMYARVAIDQGVERSAIAIPQQAIQRDAGGRSQVFVATEANAAEVRNVTVGRAIGNRSVITGGLAVGDKVIVEGFQKIRAGAPVQPEPWQPATEPAEANAHDAAAESRG